MRLFSVFFISFLLITCNKESVTTGKEQTEPILPKSLDNYNSSSMSHDPIDDQLATLGRVLFYDKKLSNNFSVSCASCHKQSLAFGDNKAKSIGFSGMETLRNSLAIINLNKFNPLFWDARQNQLDSMVIDPILNHIEMGVGHTDVVISRISHYDYYLELFEKSFGDKEVNRVRIGRALAEFIRSIRTSDNFVQRMNSIQHSEGSKLFSKYGCNNCHALGNINTSWGADMANTGLDMNDVDLGAGKTFNIREMNGFFKIPSLINVGLTAPYMHDGRFNTLEEVLEHYSTGIMPNKNLDFRLREGFEDLLFSPSIVNRSQFFTNQKNINDRTLEVKPRLARITEQDKKTMILFLKSLTDEDLIRDKKFSNPFLSN